MFQPCPAGADEPLWSNVDAFADAACRAPVGEIFNTPALTRRQIEAAWNLYRMPGSNTVDGLGLLVIGRSVGPRSVGADIVAGIGAAEFRNFGHTPLQAIHCDADTGKGHADAPQSLHLGAPPSCALLHMGRSSDWTLLANACLVMAQLERGAPIYLASEVLPENLLRPHRGVTVFACELALAMAAGYRPWRSVTPSGDPWCSVLVPGPEDDRRDRIDLASAAMAIRRLREDPAGCVRDLTAFAGSRCG